MPAFAWKRVVVVPLVVAVSASTQLHCAASGSPDAVSATVSAGPCEAMKTGDFSRMPLRGAGRIGEAMRALLTQASAAPRSAPLYEKAVIDACVELGLAAGVAESELRAAPDSGRGAEKACNVAATKVRAMFQEAKDQKILLDVRVNQTPCLIDAAAARACLANCGVTAHGDMRAECVGGELVGTCQGRCASKCTFAAGPGGGTCGALCSGRCDRDFRGICRGTCVGVCDGAPLGGPAPCRGICEGACDSGDGYCGGRCDGQCNGSWEKAYGGGSCTGICMGGCAGEVADPLCSGEYVPAGTEATCQAACGAVAALTARCELPVIDVVGRSGRPSPQLVKLLYGVQTAVPKILRQGAAAKRLARALESAIAASNTWSDAYAKVGETPFACARAAVTNMKEASDEIDLILRATDGVAWAIKTDAVSFGK